MIVVILSDLSGLGVDRLNIFPGNNFVCPASGKTLALVRSWMSGPGHYLSISTASNRITNLPSWCLCRCADDAAERRTLILLTLFSVLLVIITVPRQLK
jgi:hypothetical protein